MVDIQATAGIIDLVVKGVTILFLIIAVSLAIKKKNNLCLGVAILGNLIVYFVTKSPLSCWIVSIACIIWASSAKSAEQKTPEQNKQPLKSSKSPINNKKMVKPGPIIGLIIGILLVFFPVMGFMTHEASMSDPQGQMIGFGFIIFGAFMVIVNIIVLATGKENLLASSPAQTTTTVTTVLPAKVSSKAKSEESEESEENMIRCRFCKKRYSSEFNGCPYCKKK